MQCRVIVTLLWFPCIEILHTFLQIRRGRPLTTCRCIYLSDRSLSLLWLKKVVLHLRQKQHYIIIIVICIIVYYSYMLDHYYYGSSTNQCPKSITQDNGGWFFKERQCRDGGRGVLPFPMLSVKPRILHPGTAFCLIRRPPLLRLLNCISLHSEPGSRLSTIAQWHRLSGIGL